jgi:hypothetical protein
MRNICVAVGVLVGVAVVSPRPAQAIPPFAREYGVPCSTCHITVTRRNEFGDAFRRAGYRWPTKLGSDESGRPVAPVEMRGTSMVNSLLPARAPIGLITYFSGAYSQETDQATFGNPALSLVFGGNLGNHTSVFGVWSGNGSPSELAASFSRIAGRRELNLRVGLFEQNTTLFKSNEALLGNGFLIGSANPSGHAVQAGRIGVEANGVLGKRLFYAAGVVQNGGPGSHGDAYYHIGTKRGGMTFTGDEPDVDLDNPSFWDDASVQVATWGYFGRVEDAGKPTARVRRFGLDGQLNLPFGSLWGGVMAGHDRDFTKADPITGDWLINKSFTWFGEATYRVAPYLTAAYIYQYHDATDRMKGEQIESHDVGLIGLLQDNIRLRLKFRYTPDGKDNEAVDLQALIGF